MERSDHARSGWWRNRSRRCASRAVQCLRQLELGGAAAMGEPFQVAKHDRRAGGRAGDHLLVKDRPIGIALRRNVTFGLRRGDPPLPCGRCALCATGPGTRPGARPRKASPRPSPSGVSIWLDEPERGRKPGRVFRVVRIAQHATADPKDHRPMTDHQFFERRLNGLVLSGDKIVHKLRIGHSVPRAPTRNNR